MMRALFVVFLLLVLSPSLVMAGDVTLAWDPNSETDLAGYKLYYGTASGAYTESIDVGNVNEFTITGLDTGVLYYFAATAYDVDGNESYYSNEVSHEIASDVPPPVFPQDLVSPSTLVIASADDGNVPKNTVDGDLGTRWSAQGDGQWIQYDLGSVCTLKYMKIAWYMGNARQETFDIEVSVDGQSWSNIFSGVSSGTTLELEQYNFYTVDGRFVRITGHGNNLHDWNSITEFMAYGYPGTVVTEPAFNLRIIFEKK